MTGGCGSSAESPQFRALTVRMHCIKHTMPCLLVAPSWAYSAPGCLYVGACAFQLYDLKSLTCSIKVYNQAWHEKIYQKLAFHSVFWGRVLRQPTCAEESVKGILPLVMNIRPALDIMAISEKAGTPI